MEWVQAVVSMWVCRSCGITCHCHQMSHSCSVAMEFNNTEFRTSLPMSCLCSTVFRCVHWNCISSHLGIGSTQILQLWFTQTPIIFYYHCPLVSNEWGLSYDTIILCPPMSSHLLILSILMLALFSFVHLPLLVISYVHVIIFRL